ncbi:MAG TPA: GAF domain-containing protein [Mycobacteriales bacterium]|nr:GAF domain-containing protein [Mycobacteriales bacterium]
MFAQVLDVTERRAAEERGERVRRLYAALAATVELAQKAQTRAEMFEGACRVLVDAAGLRLASVAVVDETTGDASVTVVATPPNRVGDDLADLTAAHLPLDPADPRAGTPAARALAQGVAAWSGDFETDPAMAPLREQARRAQLRSAAAVPLRVDGRVVGVLATFAATPGFFDQAVLTLVERVGAAISRGWEALESAARRQAAEDELRARIAQQSTVVHLGEEALVVDDVGDLMRSAVDAVARTLGVQLAEVRLTGAPGSGCGGTA